MQRAYACHAATPRLAESPLLRRSRDLLAPTIDGAANLEAFPDMMTTKWSVCGLGFLKAAAAWNVRICVPLLAMATLPSPKARIWGLAFVIPSLSPSGLTSGYPGRSVRQIAALQQGVYGQGDPRRGDVHCRGRGCRFRRRLLVASGTEAQERGGGGRYRHDRERSTAPQCRAVIPVRCFVAVVLLLAVVVASCVGQGVRVWGLGNVWGHEHSWDCKSLLVAAIVILLALVRCG